jgi:acyl dehydratase
MSGLGALYARALVGAASPRRGDALPEDVLERDDVEIDREHLAAYDHVCGFRLSERLPPTYLHVVAFPLAMELMTRSSFPISVLGLVHVTNVIDELRPVATGEQPSLRVWAENLRAHRRGRQFDLVAQARVGDELVWTDRSTYLRREHDAGTRTQVTDTSVQEPEPPDEAAARIDVPGDIGRRYAAVSGDRNPIHLHGLGAKLFGIRGPIAHGMWMKARCLAAFEDKLGQPARYTVRFKQPLRIPASAGLASARRDDEVAFALRSGDGDKVHLTGSIGAPR